MPTKYQELSLYFPYPKYREGQKQAISDIFNSVLNNNHVILDARNGFGKTITVLSSIVPYAKERGLKIV